MQVAAKKKLVKNHTQQDSNLQPIEIITNTLTTKPNDPIATMLIFTATLNFVLTYVKARVHYTSRSRAIAVGERRDER